jgi:hypothetical protein
VERSLDAVATVAALLGHATVGTTEAYLSAPAFDDLAAAVSGVTFKIERPFSLLVGAGANPVEATGIEPV